VNLLNRHGDLKSVARTSRTNDADRHVGNRIRERRIMLGLSQHQLADLTCVTYQQLHKFERGLNRVTAGRLFDIAQILGVPIDYFFEGLGPGYQPSPTVRQRMCLELARNFTLIADPRHQEALRLMARALATEP
jgi:transcriptional regulator with XRE-family HTH domain